MNLKKLSFKILIFGVLFFLVSPVSANSLEPPTIIYPTQSDFPIWAGTINFKWTDTDADFYKYHINLPDGQSKEETINSTGKIIYDLKAGDYSWAVCSCNDSRGNNCGEWSSSESFIVSSPPAEFSGGLIPCGRKYDNPDTAAINESEPCQFKHIFLLLKNILDFLLWRLGPIIFVLLILTIGVLSYFSFGSPGIIARVRSILKSAITGYILIFLAWIIINIVLKLVGYTVKWWIITF